MALTPNPQSALEAIAAMPNLEMYAETLGPYSGRSDPLSMVVYLAAQWGWPSRNQLSSVLSTSDSWDKARDSAQRVGRKLGPKPPTHDQLRHLRDRAPEDLGAQMARLIPAATAPIAAQVGLVQPTPLTSPHRINRANLVFGDGSVFHPVSQVRLDENTGEAVGSRSTGKIGPRFSSRYYGKDDDSEGLAGLPVAILGAHGGEQRQRLVLGMSMYFDRNEIGSAMSLFHQIHAVYGAGIHGVIYDRLMSGVHLREIMKSGVIPIVDMKNAPAKGPSVALCDDIRWLCGTKGSPRDRAVVQSLGAVSHEVGTGLCTHDLWALDGAIVTCEAAETPDADALVVEQTSMWWDPDPAGGWRLMGRYRVPCAHGSFAHIVELSGQRVSTSGEERALADVVRPVDITAHLRDMRGLRSDAESVFRTMKGATGPVRPGIEPRARPLLARRGRRRDLDQRHRLGCPRPAPHRLRAASRTNNQGPPGAPRARAGTVGQPRAMRPQIPVAHQPRHPTAVTCADRVARTCSAIARRALRRRVGTGLRRRRFRLEVDRSSLERPRARHRTTATSGHPGSPLQLGCSAASKTAPPGGPEAAGSPRVEQADDEVHELDVGQVRDLVEIEPASIVGSASLKGRPELTLDRVGAVHDPDQVARLSRGGLRLGEPT